MTTNNTSTQNEYYNLWLTGACYVTDIRLVTSRGSAYLSLTLKGLKGRKDQNDTLYIRSANVVGQQAKDMARKLYELWIQTPEQEKRPDENFVRSRLNIFARFCLGDLEPSVFKGRDGEPRWSLQGRLLKLTSVHIDGQRMFEELDEPMSSSNADAA